jgi:hypothetical protein
LDHTIFALQPNVVAVTSVKLASIARQSFSRNECGARFGGFAAMLLVVWEASLGVIRVSATSCPLAAWSDLDIGCSTLGAVWLNNKGKTRGTGRKLRELICGRFGLTDDDACGSTTTGSNAAATIRLSRWSAASESARSDFSAVRFSFDAGSGDSGFGTDAAAPVLRPPIAKKSARMGSSRCAVGRMLGWMLSVSSPAAKLSSGGFGAELDEWRYNESDMPSVSGLRLRRNASHGARRKNARDSGPAAHDRIAANVQLAS